MFFINNCSLKNNDSFHSQISATKSTFMVEKSEYILIPLWQKKRNNKNSIPIALLSNCQDSAQFKYSKNKGTPSNIFWTGKIPDDLKTGWSWEQS